MTKALNHSVIRAGLETLYFSGAHVLLRPLLAGVGSILTLHHVRPARPDRFQPNRLLEVTPAFLDALLRDLRRAGIDLIDLDEVHRRLIERDFRRRFVSLTIDDGYRDTLEHAYPALKRYDAPFAVYVPTSFPDRLGQLWWLALEAIIARNSRVGLLIDGVERHFDCATLADKQALFDGLYWWLRSFETEDELRRAVADLCGRYSIDIARYCDEMCMTWEEIVQLAADPLVTIGAHTVNHVILKKVTDRSVRTEIQMGTAVLEAALGKKPEHFAYPFGDSRSAGPREFRVAADLGFKTAVTTRPGVLFAEHRDHLLALPRISVNGNYQALRYTRVLLSGAPTGLANRFRRVDAA